MLINIRTTEFDEKSGKIPQRKKEICAELNRKCEGARTVRVEGKYTKRNKESTRSKYWG